MNLGVGFYGMGCTMTLIGVMFYFSVIYLADTCSFENKNTVSFLAENCQYGFLIIVIPACMGFIGGFITDYQWGRTKKEEERILTKQNFQCTKCHNVLTMDDNKIKIIDRAVDKIYCTDCYTKITGSLRTYDV